MSTDSIRLFGQKFKVGSSYHAEVSSSEPALSGFRQGRTKITIGGIGLEVRLEDGTLAMGGSGPVRDKLYFDYPITSENLLEVDEEGSKLFKKLIQEKAFHGTP